MTKTHELVHTVSGPHRLYVRRIPAGVGLDGDQVSRVARALMVAAGESVDEPEKDPPIGGESTPIVTEAYPGELENLRTLRRDVERATSQRPIDDPVVVALIDHLSYAPMVDATLAALARGGEGQ